MKSILAIVLITLTAFACNNDSENQNSPSNNTTYLELPNDLTKVPDEAFLQIVEWTKDAEIIGVSEGEHGMNEGMNFRNSYIKYLVRKNRVQVVAIESGIVESRLINDYINGADLNIDTVLTYGISYTFGQFEQNKELLNWLRKTNETRDQDNRIHFYGFDMSGSAPNPFLDDGSYALKECLKYIKIADIELYNEVLSKAKYYFPYLNIPESPESDEKSFLDLSQEKKSDLNQMINHLIGSIQKNKEFYIEKIGKEKYGWALRSAVCAKQNLEFLEGYLSEDKDQSVREQFMLDNLKWIKAKEGDKKIVIFAHIAHLAKDITRPDETGNETLPENMFGELLANEFGSRYQVIGNFFNYLDYYDAIDSVEVNSFPDILHKKYKASNFCTDIDENDSLYLKPRIFGIPFRGKLWMTPIKGVDVILYTEKQHYFYKE